MCLIFKELNLKETKNTNDSDVDYHNGTSMIKNVQNLYLLISKTG